MNLPIRSCEADRVKRIVPQNHQQLVGENSRHLKVLLSDFLKHYGIY